MKGKTLLAGEHIDLEQRNRLAFAIAGAIDEEDALEPYLQQGSERGDIGLAPADGAIHELIAFMLEYANWCTWFIGEYGLDALSTATGLATLRDQLSKLLKKWRVNLRPEEEDAILKSLLERLNKEQRNRT